MRPSAWYIPSRNGAAVVVLPGAGSTRTSVLGQAAVLAGHGYGALLVDGRGHGLSGGHAMDFGWWGGRDIAAAVSILARQPSVQAGKMAVLGESMGGEQALAATGSDPRIRAVVAEGVTGQQLADHGWLPHGIDGALWPPGGGGNYLRIRMFRVGSHDVGTLFGSGARRRGPPPQATAPY